jgi:thiopurine S-methyltransferase
MLITFEYDQAEMSGPPFSISQDEVFAHYRDAYQIESVTRQVMPGGFKGKIEATEVVWLLRALQDQP